MTSINEQMIDYFDRSGKKGDLFQMEGNCRRLTKSDTSINIDPYVKHSMRVAQ